MLTVLCKNSVLACWAVFFIWLISAGQPHLARLLHPRLWWLVACGAAVLLLFVAASLRRRASAQAQLSIWWHLPSLLILVVPLLYFLPMQSARFNADTFAKRSVQSADGFLRGEVIEGVPVEEGAVGLPGGEGAEVESGEEVSLSLLFKDIRKYLGKEVEVVCQAMKDERLPDDLLVCYRFRITCCAADAQPLFVFIRSAGKETVSTDAWIRAKGPLSVFSNAGVEIPLVTAASITVEKEPRFPFVF